MFHHLTNNELDAQDWASAIWTGAYYYTDLIPIWPDAMDPASLGILALAPGEAPPWVVPEPAAILLALLALALLPRRRRR